MGSTDGEIGFRGYRICGYYHSLEGETPAWFTLQIRLNGKSFNIRASPSKFYDSPKITAEFFEFFAFLVSGSDLFEDEIEETGSDTGSEAPTNRAITIDRCFDWAVRPFLPILENLAPQRTDLSNVTLQDYLSSESFECELGSMNDKLEPGPVILHERMDDWMESSFGSSPWKTTLPSFHPSRINIIGDDPRYILDEDPARVCVNGQELFFKSFDFVGEEIGKGEVAKHEQIFRANLRSHIRTSRAYGVVQGDNGRPLGILLYRIDEDTTLTGALSPITPENTKRRWALQLRESLQALHQAGIIWGDAKPDNVIIDRQGDAWIIDFGGGHTKGWVDENKAGTVEGDLQGLRNILKFLFGEGSEWINSTVLLLRRSAEDANATRNSGRHHPQTMMERPCILRKARRPGRPGKRFTRVIMLNEQMRAAGDAELQRLVLNARCYQERRRIPWETGITVVTPLNRNRWNLNKEASVAFQARQRSATWLRQMLVDGHISTGSWSISVLTG
ncbi:hypothetical protein HIM_11287 [Hirsutella minnesotensis 3608]|uniref:Protein kinase domain-containing protein n=1 Tax=Hirsutella minnesotensis 3608 TaxID=1043627 RepID=A0A0F8A1E1_9HYPO|nr:hypothetical protein HIM_11287 [Hirsutella minnesotensis 3608]